MKLKLLTDELIYQYTRDNVLTEYRDINLKVTTKVDPYPKGVYDQEIFGSIFSDRCNCGTVRTPGIRCPRCGSKVLDEDESFRKFARIESPVYFVATYNKKLIEFIKSNFAISSRFETDEFKGMQWKSHQCMDICQWEYDPDTNRLTLTDQVTDFSKCSYEGLMTIIQMHKKELLNEYKSYINRYVMVMPMALRAPVYKVVSERNRPLTNNEITTIYQNIIYAIHVYYKEVFPTIKEEFDKSVFRGCLRALIHYSLSKLSRLTWASKPNLARAMQSNRLGNSGRCVIVPDPTLKADEACIPRHLMYEVCRDEFIQYLSEHMSVPPKEAEYIYKNRAEDPEIQSHFDKYIEGDGTEGSAKYVILNRAPSLYELGMCSCKVKLTNDYAMKIPQTLCSPFGADFDGDQMSFYAIPKDMSSMINETMSPRNIFLYRKNHAPIYTPSHEMMQGLILATKVQVPDKMESFTSIDEAQEFRKSHPEFRYQTLCLINGTKTTIARYILSDLFDKDINAYLGSESKSLNAKNSTILYEQLRDKKDRLERIQKIQQFALTIATISGATVPRLSELYIDIDQEYLDKIRKVIDDPSLDQKTKEVTVRTIYMEFQKKELEMIPEGVKTMVTESARAKLTQLRDMAVQQLNVSPEGTFSVANTTIAKGMDPVDFENHAIENRGILEIKHMSVPSSGYLTRQFIYLASEYYLRDGEDENNEGILIERSRAEGRTGLDGKVFGPSTSNEMVKVRSVVTSTLGKGVLTRDMLSNKFDYRTNSHLGMALISALTEGLTQSSLALKHGGNLFILSKDEALIAPEDCVLDDKGDWIVLTLKNGKSLKYPKGSEWVSQYSPNNQFKKGEEVGRNYHSITPAYKLDSIIKLCLANHNSSKKRFANNYKIVSDCYCRASGTIHYTQNASGDFEVTIGDEQYDYNPEVIYKFPEGAHVEKYDRICSGVMNTITMSRKLNNYLELFYFYRKQFEELTPSDHYAPELIEFLYSLISHRNEDGSADVNRIKSVIKGSDSWFKSLAFGWASESFNQIGYEGIEFQADPITSVTLSLIMNDEII